MFSWSSKVLQIAALTVAVWVLRVGVVIVRRFRQGVEWVIGGS